MQGNMDFLSLLNNGMGGNQQGNFSSIGSLGYNPTQSPVLQGDLLSGASAPNTGAGGFNFGNLMSFDNLGSIAQGIGSLGQLYMGGQQLGLARDAFNQSKEAYNRNMGNQVTSYNTALEDRIRGRTSNYEGKEADVKNYVDSNRMK